jgi:hypothetical protein
VIGRWLGAGQFHYALVGSTAAVTEYVVPDITAASAANQDDTAVGMPMSFAQRAGLEY